MARKKLYDEAQESQTQYNNGHKSKSINCKNSLNETNSNGKLHKGLHQGSKAGKNNVDEAFYSLLKQLKSIGLTIREMPGDGNCLFRSLADQLEGHTRNHLNHRKEVVDFMTCHRNDFEPFVEDDMPFESYVHTLSQAGIFGGNDCIVAFSRLHNVKVVIHQLNAPAWIINPNQTSTREVHVSYHNGDHYNSVRRSDDDSETPTNIILAGHMGTNSTSGGNSVNNKGKGSNPNSPKPRSPSPNLPNPTEESNEGGQDIFKSGGLFQSPDNEIWLKDPSDLENYVSILMQQTNCFDRNFVRETFVSCDCDMRASADMIMEIMVQTGCLPQVEESRFPPEDYNSVLAKNERNSGSSSGSEDGHSDENNDEKENMGGLSPSQSQKSLPKKPKSQLTARQRKELKKQRKRERDMNRRKTDAGENQENNIVVVSNLGTLDI